MAWNKLANASGSGDDFNTGTFTPSKFLEVLYHLEATGGDINGQNRVGNTTIDSGNNYAWRYSTNGGADSASTSRDYLYESSATSNNGESGFRVLHIVNIASEEKLIIGFSIDQLAVGAGTAPNRMEFTHKWVNTSNQIDIVGGHSNSGAGDFTSDTDLTVLGSDGTEELNVQDGAIYYDTDLNKEYVLYNNTWTEV